MNILYITSVFPRPEDGATIYTDLACELSRRGHNLTVAVADGSAGPLKTQCRKERGMEVLRIRTGALYNVGLIKKGMATLLLSRHLKRGIRRHLKNRLYDLILYETPPLSIYKAVKYAKKKWNAASFLMLKDIFPQNGADLGLYKESGLVYRYFKKQENALYRVSDYIGCMSAANMAYIKTHNPSYSGKVVFFPNTKAVSPMPAEPASVIRERFCLPQDKVIFVFGGNIGLPQAPENIIACAKEICRLDDAFFLAIGRGTHTDYVRRALCGMKNLKVLGNMERCRYEQLLSACDVGLIFLDGRFSVPNFPSRILSYMNFSLPVLASTDNVSDIKDLIQTSGCGYWCKAGAPTQFGAYAKILCNNKDQRKKMGKKGFLYFKDHFHVGVSSALLETYLEHVKDETK